MFKNIHIYFISFICLPITLSSQSNCDCEGELKFKNPILTSFKDQYKGDSLSVVYLKALLDKSISKDSIDERFHTYMYVTVDQGGMVCQLSFKDSISQESKKYLLRALAPLFQLNFYERCYNFSLQLVIDELLNVNDSVFGISVFNPILEGCDQTASREDISKCMLEQREMKIFRHPLYNDLNIESSVVVQFVVTKTGDFTLFKFKHGNCDIGILKKILKDAGWIPGKNKKGEAVNVNFILPLKPYDPFR